MRCIENICSLGTLGLSSSLRSLEFGLFQKLSLFYINVVTEREEISHDSKARQTLLFAR